MVRSGIGINEAASIDLAGIKGAYMYMYEQLCTFTLVNTIYTL